MDAPAAEGSIPLTVIPAIDLVPSPVEQLEDGDSTHLIPFTIVGPRRAVSLLSEELGPSGLTGSFSPFAPVTLEGPARKAVGIPEQAKYFSFAYPLQATHGRFEAMIARAQYARQGFEPTFSVAPCGWLLMIGLRGLRPLRQCGPVALLHFAWRFLLL